MSNLFFQKEADPIRKRLQQKNLSVWKGFRLKIKSSKKLFLGEYGRQRTSKKFHDLVLNLTFQNSRVLETIMFQALFSRQKVSNISFKIEFSLHLSYHPVYTKVEKQCVQNNKNAYVCKHTHSFLFYFPCSNRSTV